MDDQDTEEERSEMIQDFIRAGEIAGKVIREARRLIIPGQSYLDIAESIEKLIVDFGGSPGFPVNISVNEIAAHDTPVYNDERVLGEEGIVKVDFGVHVNGCVSDNAFTIDLSEDHPKLVEATQEALDEAINSIRPGKTTGEIGEVIENVIRDKYGLKPISNLSGHMILPYILHAGPTIPNISRKGGYVIQEGDVFAIEPFATTSEGRGEVKDDLSFVEIFSLEDIRNVRLRRARQIIVNVFQERFTLPFCKRWLYNRFGYSLVVGMALRELSVRNLVVGYPRLVEENNQPVGQTERTVIVEHDSARVLE